MNTMQLNAARLGLALAMASALAAAQAQQAGTYFGTTTQGRNLRIDVSQDASTGEYLLSHVALDADLSCPRSGTTPLYTLTVNDSAAFTDGRIVRDYGFVNLVEHVALRFNAFGGLSGTLNAAVPVFAAPGENRSVEACSSGKVSFSIDLVPTVSSTSTLSAGQRPPSGSAVVKATTR